mgnify:CR=1 FL=1
MGKVRQYDADARVEGMNMHGDTILLYVSPGSGHAKTMRIFKQRGTQEVAVAAILLTTEARGKLIELLTKDNP